MMQLRPKEIRHELPYPFYQRFHSIHSFNALFEQSFIRRIIVHEREAQYLSSIEGKGIFLQGLHASRDYTSSVP